MKNRKSFAKALPLAILVIFFCACTDEFDKFTPDQPLGNIDDFFERIPDSEEQFVVDNSSGQTIVTAHRTLIHIPPDAFVTQTGSLPTGPVEFRITELYTMGDFLLHNVPTVSDGRLLESDGVFRLQATSAGEILRLQDGKNLKFQVPDRDPNRDMGLFYGSRSADSTFNWSTVDVNNDGEWDNVETSEWAFQDSLNNWFDFGYEFFIDSLTWINVDIFNDVPDDQKTEVCVELPELYTNKNTIVYLVFKDISSVVTFGSDADRQLFCEPYGLVPIGYEVCFVVISNQGEDIFHFALVPAVIDRNHQEFIAPEETSIEDILEALGKL